MPKKLTDAERRKRIIQRKLFDKEQLKKRREQQKELEKVIAEKDKKINNFISITKDNGINGQGYFNIGYCEVL